MKLAVDKKDLFAEIKKLLLVVLGTCVLAFGFSTFMVPYDLVAGGVSGIAIVLDEIIEGTRLGEFISLDLIVTVLTWGLFILGFIFLGKAFAMKTLVSSIVYPPAISIFIRLSSPDVFGGYFYLPGSDNPEIAFLISAFAGGALVGLGCALTFLGGGSTGGTDIIAFIICKIFPKLRSSRVIFMVDCSVVVLGMLVIGDIVVSALGVVSAIVSALMIDKIFLGGSKTFIAQIISDKHERLREEILVDLNRGATIIDVVGAYSGDDKKMIMVSFTMRQYNQIINIINKTDKEAFVTVHRAHEISGKGFSLPKKDG